MRRTNTGVLALAVLGGIYVYRNRFKIQQFLERQGIRTPVNMGNVADTVRSGVAKMTGMIQGQVETLKEKTAEQKREVA